MNTLAPNKLLHIPIIILLMGMLGAGCTSMQSGQPSESTSGKAARQLSAQGDHTAASRTYLELAVTSAGEQRQRYLIFSASELYLANDLDGADRILAEAGETITPENLELWAQVTAELRLAQGDPEAALTALNQVTSSESQVTASHILLLRSDALFKLDRPEIAVATLLQREAILNQRKDIQANNRYIWTGLQVTGGSIPPNISSREGDAILNGWLELGYISYSNRTSLTALSLSLEQWRETNPEHPASGDLLEEVLDGLSTLSNYPNRVAILLPLSGKQKSLGEAIRDGYMAAHFSLGSDIRRPDIRIYDTARNGVTTAYQQAILGGAEFVIGPLLKTEVAEIAGLSDDMPTLALNFGPEDTDYPDRFYQFALFPEFQARASANKAVNEGLYNAVALVPESAWGERILAAFQDELEQRGGKLLATRSYPTDSADYADVIRDVLLLNESHARRDRLAANMGKELEFKPRRRQDVDLVFIAATVAKGKQIKPQLKFHYAGELPTYATSAIYKPGSTDNADINGVLFPDMPWLLKPTQMVTYDKTILDKYWGTGSTRLARFYAMGYDAFHLSAMLNSTKRARSINLQGMTGDIYMTRDGLLHRRLSWAKMERGKPRTLPDTSRSLTQDAEIIIR